MNKNSSLGEIARMYLKAIEQGDRSAVFQYYASDIVQNEFPNRLIPTGAQRNFEQLEDAFDRGSKVMTSQTYEVLNVIESGNQVVVETNWSGTLAVPFGDIPQGGQMQARFAIVLEFRDGKIIRQNNYDCFEPF